MYYIVFKDRTGKETELGRDTDIARTLEYMDDFLHNHHFVPPYYRYIGEVDKDGEMTIDVGSHTEFFIIRPTKEEEKK